MFGGSVPDEEVQANDGCPSVKSASAWINRQPSTDGAKARLVVSVRLNELEQWMAFRVEGEDPADLSLELRPGGEGYAGIVGYREPLGRQPRERVSILCNGRLIGEVAQIHSVY
ncbi:MAG: hypothetical protein QNI84_13480 [Henriciella sp.]|nr:hypothetical protein [Henriciella sp.]